MARENTITFSRDVDTGPACLQYSWVPEGHKKEIKLLPHENEGSRIDSVSDNVSRVQVYCLVSNSLGVEMLHLPPGAPYQSPVISVEIRVYESGMYVAATINYADGASTKGSCALTPHPLPCPKLPEQ